MKKLIQPAALSLYHITIFRPFFETVQEVQSHIDDKVSLCNTTTVQWPNFLCLEYIYLMRL